MKEYDDYLARQVEENLTCCTAYDNDFGQEEACKNCVEYCEEYLETIDTADLILEAIDLNEIDHYSCLYTQSQRKLRTIEKEINKRGQKILQSFEKVA